MIEQNVKNLLSELPSGVTMLAAAKERNADEISRAINAGVTVVGENYLQDALRVINEVKGKAEWHFIGHLQRNKVRKVAEIFDMIESVDSLRLAKEIEKCCQRNNKVMPILIEVNSGEEEQKHGTLPQEVISLVKEISSMPHIRVMGLMTMGPFAGDPEDARPYFQKTRHIFEDVKKMSIPNVEMIYLSMGMSNSYKVALEEGANVVRIGTNIFGERN